MSDIFKDGNYTIRVDDPDLNFKEHFKAIIRIKGDEAAQSEDVDLRLGEFEEKAATILSASGYPTNLADLCAKLGDEGLGDKRKGSDYWPSELLKLAHDMLVYVKAIKDHIHHKRIDQAVCWTIDLCKKAVMVDYLIVYKKAHERASKDPGGRKRKQTDDEWIKTFKEHGHLSNSKIAEMVGCHPSTVSRNRNRFK